jgi:DNA-binding transcriptional MerR regulator
MLYEVLAVHRSKENLRIDDLVHLAAEVIPQVAGRQDRHKVTAIPDTRTLRYYIHEGLVDRPHGTTGPSALYGYRHLLQLVAVKVLQSHYLPIRRIREVLQTLDTPALEERLQAWGQAIAPEATNTSEATVLSGSEPRSSESTVAEPPVARLPIPKLRLDRHPGGTRDHLRSLEARPSRGSGAAGLPWAPRSVARAPSGSIEEPPSPAKEPEHLVDSLLDRSMLLERATRKADPGAGWSRFELHPGVELHVRHGIDLPQSPSFFSALASRLRAILQQLGREAPKKQ